MWRSSRIIGPWTEEEKTIADNIKSLQIVEGKHHRSQVTNAIQAVWIVLSRKSCLNYLLFGKFEEILKTSESLVSYQCKSFRVKFQSQYNKNHKSKTYSHSIGWCVISHLWKDLPLPVDAIANMKSSPCDHLRKPINLETKSI